MKRTLAMLLALVMLLGMLPTVALAEEITDPALPEEVQSDLAASGAGAIHIRDFSAVSGKVDSNTTIVEDEASAIGQAVKLDTSNVTYNPGLDALSTAKPLEIGILNKGTIGTIAYEDLLANAGDGKYHTYKVNDAKIQLTNVETLYFFGYAHIQISTPTDTLWSINGKLADIYVSMKIEGTDLGLGGGRDNWPKYYVDRIVIVEECSNYIEETAYTPFEATCTAPAGKQALCPECGGTYKVYGDGAPADHVYGDYTYDAQLDAYVAKCVYGCGDYKPMPGNLLAPVPAAVLNELAASGIGVSHVQDFNAADEANFFGDSGAEIRADADAAFGKALVMDLKTSKPFNKIYAAINAGGGMDVGILNRGNIGRIPYEEIAANVGNGYQVYKLEDFYMNLNNTGTFYFFGNAYVRFTNSELWNYNQKTVDLYISMKVEGTDVGLAGNGSQFPTYSIDRIILVDKCANYIAEDAYTSVDATCTSDACKQASCPQCGGTYKVYEADTMIDHVYGDYVYDAELGAYVAYCEYGCGSYKETTEAPEAPLPEKVQNDLAASGAGMIHVKDIPAAAGKADGNTTVVADADAAYGQALKLDISTVTYNPGLDVLGPTKPLEIGIINKGTIGTIAYEDLLANAGDGKYHTYKVNDAKIQLTNVETLYFFGYAHIQVTAPSNTLWSINGKTADIYVSMKIENTDLSLGGSSANYPKYYIDRIVIVEECSNYIAEDAYTTVDATCTTDACMQALCPQCGGTYKTYEADTMIDHVYGDYAYDAELGAYVAYCEYGCGSYKTMEDGLLAPLPETVRNELTASGIGMSHVHDFDVYESALEGGTFTGNGAEIREDADAAFGHALVMDLKTSKPFNKIYAAINAGGGMDVGILNRGNIGKIPYEEIAANVGNGYQVYKLEDFYLNLNNTGTIYFFGNAYVRFAGADATLWSLNQKKVDLYISMKVEGTDLGLGGSSANFPTYSIDRILVVDKCANYIAEDAYTSVAATCTEDAYKYAACPECEGTYKIYEADTALGHSAELTFNYETSYMEGSCSVCGEPAKELPENLLTVLPADVLADMAADSTDISKVYDFRGMDGVMGRLTDQTNAMLVTDEGSTFEQVARITREMGDGIAFHSSQMGRLNLSELSAEYTCHKINVHMFETGLTYGKQADGTSFVDFFGEYMKHYGMGEVVNGALAGKEFDFYVNMRLETAEDGREVMYFDRFILIEKGEATTYTVTFVNGDEETPVTVTHGQYSLNKPADPTVEGKTFLGWYDGETKYVFSEKPFDSDLTLTAKFAASTYTVDFIVNDTAVDTQTVNHGEYATDPGALPMEGMTFIGWFTEDDVQFDFTTAITSDLTLYAKYEAEEEEPTILEGTLAAIEVSMDSELLLWLKFTLPEELINDDNAYAIVSANRKGGVAETTIPMTEIRAKGADSRGRYIIEQGMAAPEMGRDVTVSFVDGNGNYVNLTDYADGSVATSVSRSIIDYSKLALEKGTTAQKNLNKALLAYGGYAQAYFNVDAAAPVYNVLTEMGMEVPDVAAIDGNSITQELTSTGAALVKASSQQAFLDSAIYHQVYFTLESGVSIDDLSFELTKRNKAGEYTEVVEPVYDSTKNRYYIQIDGIASPLLDYMYNVEITSTSGDVQNVQTSVAAYLKLGITKSTNTKQVNMFKAMYNYNQVANTFFGF